MEGFCRGCLIKYNEPTDLVPYSERNRRLFIYSTGLQVKRNDTFTFQLCKDCYLNMKLACKFKKLCRTSDKQYKNYHILKEAEENLDFCTFLKNSEDSMTLRFPLMNGSSTPANQMCKDDDNESTCTSIRNFMTDILQGEDVPDTEASIIREVIEEEADVTDDSLDSHWLQDDMSIATDFRLDFSLSPFCTPHLTNHDHCYTPKRLEDHNEQERINYYTSKEIMEKPDQVDTAIKQIDVTDLDEQNNDYFKTNELENNEIVDIVQNNDDDELLKGKYPNYYIQRDIFEESIQVQMDDDMSVGLINKQCTIDRNLEKALKNESNNEFSLDDLLVSSPVIQGASAPSTPTINNILFGEKLDLNSNDSNGNKVGQLIENFHQVEGHSDILDDFFNKSNDTFEGLNLQNSIQIKVEDDLEFEPDNVEINEANPKIDEWSIEDKFDVENSYCKICTKQFKNNRALRVHSVKCHKIKIINHKKNAYKHTLKICYICGKEFRESSTYHRHVAQHKKTIIKDDKDYQCDRCPLVCTSKSRLDVHMSTHTGEIIRKDTGKKYVCNICGAISRHYSNFRIHKLRHTNNYTKKCEECGKGFFRSTDLAEHMRNHTGERPFKCVYCPLAFSRREVLNTHTKQHTKELFQCDHCKTTFVKKLYLKKHILNSKRCKKLRGDFVKEADVILNAMGPDDIKTGENLKKREETMEQKCISQEEDTIEQINAMNIEDAIDNIDLLGQGYKIEVEKAIDRNGTTVCIY